MAVGSKDAYVTPKFASPGDHIIITKGPAIESSGIFAAMFPEKIASELGQTFADTSQDLFYQMSVVEDALTAVSVGVREDGVTAMHDATECGIWGGVYEMAEASGLGARLNKDDIVVKEGVFEISKLFGIDDPFAAISEGTLIISCRPEKSDEVVKNLKSKEIEASVAGVLTSPEKGITVISRGHERPLAHPKVDPFWKAFYHALAEWS